MALIKCPSCGADVSDRALQCPKCGHIFHSAQSTPAPGAQTGEPKKSRFNQYLKAILLVLLIVYIGRSLVTGDSGHFAAMIPVLIITAFLLLLYALLKKKSSNSSNAQYNNAVMPEPAAAELTNWREEVPVKAFSNPVRTWTIVVSLLITLISIVMLIVTPGKPESKFAQEFTSDIFSPIRTGLWILIAANVTALITAIFNRSNNSYAVASGIIGTLVAAGITILMQYSQNVSELEGYYHLATGNAGKEMDIMIAGLSFVAIAIVVYMIIATSIAVVRRRYVARLMAHPTADKISMQQYCNNRTSMVYLWALLSIAIIAALIFLLVLLKSQH